MKLQWEANSLCNKMFKLMSRKLYILSKQLYKYFVLSKMGICRFQRFASSVLYLSVSRLLKSDSHVFVLAAVARQVLVQLQALRIAALALAARTMSR